MTERIHHLTNNELTAQLSLRDDLTEIETELLDRVIRCNDEVVRLDRENTGLHDRVSQLEQTTLRGPIQP